MGAQPLFRPPTNATPGAIEDFPALGTPARQGLRRPFSLLHCNEPSPVLQACVVWSQIFGSTDDHKAQMSVCHVQFIVGSKLLSFLGTGTALLPLRGNGVGTVTWVLVSHDHGSIPPFAVLQVLSVVGALTPIVTS